jgi:hypothetical protein
MGTVSPHVCTTNRDLKRAKIHTKKTHLENPRRDCTCLQLPTNTQIKRKNAPSPRRNAYMRIDSLSVWKIPVEMQSTRDDKNWTNLLRFVAARIRRRRPPPVVRLRRRDPEAAPPRGSPSAAGGLKPPTSRIASAAGILKPHLAVSSPRRGAPVKTNERKKITICVFRDIAGNAMAVA